MITHIFRCADDYTDFWIAQISSGCKLYVASYGSGCEATLQDF